MKAVAQSLLLSVCITSTTAMAEDYDLQLEPCINGEVSASGLFPTQKDEDRFVKTRYEASQLELEPCINGEVSASGLFPDQEAEDRYHRKQMNNYGSYSSTETDQ